MANYRIGNVFLNETETHSFFEFQRIGISFGIGLIFGLVSAAYGLEYFELSREINIAITFFWSLASSALFVKGRRMLFFVFLLTLTALFGAAFLYIFVGIIASIFR